ncbi:MAG: hypothetical protein QOG26_1318, partial [Solirubrobacterales bacterium]|nr:hypothetical protein [Solirubrobacterales bacterium]
DFDLIDIPFPEKAPPQLIKKGALQNDQQPTSANEPTAEGPPAPEPKTGSAAEASQAREPKTGSAAGTD